MRRLLPWIFWAAGMLVAFRPALLSGFAELQINPGDPRLVHYILEHTWLWIRGDPLHAGLWDPPVFYPARGVGGYSDTLLGSAPFYCLWRVLGLAEGISFQLWMMSCLSLCYVCAHWFLRRCLGFGAWPAALGAFFHAFAIVRLSNFNSAQFFTVFYALAALGALARALAPETSPRGRAAWILACAACASLQVWSAFYPGFFLFLILALAALAALAQADSRRRLVGLVRGHPLALGAALALGALSLAPLALAHWQAATEVGWRDTGVVAASQPRLQSWLYPGGKSLLYGALKQTAFFTFPAGSSYQNSNGAGFVTTLAFLFGLARMRRPATRVTLVVLGLVILVTTRFPGGFTLWPLIYDWVPGAKAARYPACIGMYAPIAVALGMACFASLWPGPRANLATALALFCCLEQVQVLEGHDESAYRALVERLAADVPPGCEAFLVLSQAKRVERELGERPPRPIPLPPPNRRTQIAAMWAGLSARKPTLNGFYGNSPPGWHLAVSIRDPDRLAAVEASLATWLETHRIPPTAIARITLAPSEFPWTEAEEQE